jgi:hypothetical protein
MSAPYLPFSEPQFQESVRRSGKAQAVAALLIGFGIGCGAMYAVGGQTPSALHPTINMAWTQPAHASRLMPPAQLHYPMQPVGLRPLVQPRSASTVPDEHDEPLANPVQQGRRELMTGLGFAAAGAILKDRAAQAAYGEGANVFGSVTNDKGFAAFAGDGFSLLLPAKWYPSKEQDFDNVVLRYEDIFDTINYLAVLKKPGEKLGGNPEEFLNKYAFLLGQQSYSGSTISEGGFAADQVASASVLDVSDETDKQGRKVYGYNILTRTADGDEGGKHQLIKAVESKGSLYILKIQIGDKRWFKGARKEAEAAFSSFTVA